MKMFSLIGTIVLAFTSMIAEEVEKLSNLDRMYCRITYYHPYQDKWGSRVACPRTNRAKQGITVAAHPSFKFGTKVYIPELAGKVGDGYFLVQDRGAWVTKKKASKGKHYVFDVFVSCKNSYSKMKQNNPYMWVYASK